MIKFVTNLDKFKGSLSGIEQQFNYTKIIPHIGEYIMIMINTDPLYVPLEICNIRYYYTGTDFIVEIELTIPRSKFSSPDGSLPDHYSNMYF